MEFKKSRLDLEGGGGTMPQETNSSTPSPAQSPFKGSGGGGGGPYRGRYTRSSLGGGGLATANTSSGGSSSRFSPYATSRDRPARRSIPVITAQREDVRPVGGIGGGFNSSFFGSTSSTAQKIMDTLASMSTPVLNAGRVRVDSIKTVRPIGMIGSSSPFNSSGTFLSATNKFSGPPKTLSPLLIPLTASGVRPDSDKSMWSSKCLSIPPKMVDCGTSTDELFPSDEKTKLSMGMSPNNNVSSQRSSTILTTTTHVKNHGGSLKLSDLLAKSRPVNGEYKFDKPLSLGDIDKYLGSDKYKKDLDKSNSSTSDGTDDDDDDDANENEDSNMSNHKIPNGDIKSSRTSTSTESKMKPETKPFAQWSTPSNQWECQVCMVFNNPSVSKCACCETPNPKAKADIVDKKVDNKWSCPTCMVSNEASAATCVCCTEKNPNFVGDSKSKDFSSSSQPPVSTSTFKFGFGSSTTSAATPVTGFTFGATSPAKTVENDKSASGGFTFGFNKTATSTTTSKSNATEMLNSNKIDNSVGKNNAFTFGTPPTSLSNSSSSSGSNFKFGVTASDEENLLSKPKPIELWQCLVCPAQNGIKIFTCVTCGSPRPREFDIGYVKPDNKISPDTKFQPVFGKKSTQQDVTSSSPPQTGTFTSTISPAVTSSSTTFGNTSFGSFGAGATGNPFGGGSGNTASFQIPSVASSGSGGFGNTTTTTTSSATTSFSTSTGNNSSAFGGGVNQTQVDGGNNTSLTSAAGSGVPSFQFGSPKRKHDESEPEGPADSAKKSLPSFQFGSSSTNAPTLKLKEPAVASIPISASSPTPQPAANPAGFLEALKNASAAVKASNEKQPSTMLTQPGGGGGSLTTKPFQFGTNNSSNPTTTSANTSTFGASTTGNSFNFGISGGSSSNAPNTFGSLPTQQSTGFTPNPPINNQFNLTPNFNFGATAPSSTNTFTFGAASNPPSSNSFSFGGAPAGSNAPNEGPPPLFQFQSNPSTGGDITGRRIIKKATRRFR